ncbi:MAG: homoaconitate hydratase [Phycisphaerales bacterium]|jgi:homoaconitate hydratase
MPQTSIEKIVTKYAVGQTTPAHAGDFVTIRPRHLMTHDNTGAVIPKFESIVGAGGKIHNPKQPMFGIDHDIQNVTPENLGKYAKIAKFAADQGVDYYPPGRGIAHQIMIEEGYAVPGSLVVGSDSHSNIYGAVAAVGTPVVRTDAAAIWATGETWWQIPPQIKVTLTGKLQHGATGKDVIISLCGHFKDDEVLNSAIEFAGDGVAQLSVDERMTISNMTTEWGALVGMFPFDDVLKDYLLGRAKDFESRSGKTPRYTAEDVNTWWAERDSFAPDAGAHYAKVLTLDLSTVSPHISGPNSVKVMDAVFAVEPKRMKIDKAYLMSCVNARLSDFADAARVFTDAGPGVKIADGVNFYVAAASSTIEAQAKDAGYWDVLVNAGATPFPAGCGACIGLGAGTLEAGEVGLSATNRNFQGRMGSRDALCYLASPAVVAQSAINGYISAPKGNDSSDPAEVSGTCTVTPTANKETPAQEILEGFPSTLTGRALYLPTDNLNTDGIYGKDVTYRDDITFEEQGQHAMLNYDPEFQSIAQDGDIIVGTRNFGTGSSREQAATALASKGIRLVIASTAGQTYKRNAFNNGFIVLECPALAEQLQSLLKPAESQLTVPGPEITVDFQASTITCQGTAHRFGALSTTAQRLIVAGGCEAVVRQQLANWD